MWRLARSMVGSCLVEKKNVGGTGICDWSKDGGGCWIKIWSCC